MLSGEKTHADRQRRMFGVACAVAVVALFSSFTLVSRLGVRSSLEPTDLAALRFAVAGVLLLPVFIRYRTSGIPLRKAVLLSFLGGLGFALLAYAGFARAPANHGAVFLHGTLPFFGMVFAAVMLGERPTAGRLLGSGLIVAGVAALAWDALRSAPRAVLTGDACLIAASACWSGYGVVVRQHGLTALRAAAIVSTLAMVVYLPGYLFLTESHLAEVSWTTLLGQAIFQGVLIGVLSIVVYTKAVTILGPTETALCTAAVPCLTTLAAVPLLGEWPSVLTAIGIVAATIGMIAALRPKATIATEPRAAASATAAHMDGGRGHDTGARAYLHCYGDLDGQSRKRDVCL